MQSAENPGENPGENAETANIYIYIEIYTAHRNGHSRDRTCQKSAMEQTVLATILALWDLMQENYSSFPKFLILNDHKWWSTGVTIWNHHIHHVAVCQNQ